MNMMADIRRTDSEARKWFRSSRFFKEGASWFFYTREGTMEGPFDTLSTAETRLEEYVKIMRSGFMPNDSKLRVEPQSEEKVNVGQD